MAAAPCGVIGVGRRADRDENEHGGDRGNSVLCDNEYLGGLVAIRGSRPTALIYSSQIAGSV